MVITCENNYLPTLVLIKIFSYLNKADRLRASSTCKTWRNCIFNKTLWPLISITINLIELDSKDHLGRKKKKNKTIFKNFLSKCCSFIEEIKIIFDPYSYSDIKLIIEILKLFKQENEKEKRLKDKQNCLKKIYLRPTSIRSLNNVNYKQGYNMVKLFDAIEDILITKSSLIDISFGLLEELLNRIPSLLHSLAKNDNYCKSLQCLHISTIKEDPDYYAVYDFPPFLLEPFSNLKIISIDYDYICDELISILASKPLENLIINVHGLDEEHPGVSDSTWNLIKSKVNPPQVTLNLLHTDDCPDLREKILNSAIPITHFRAFFLGFNDFQGIGIVDIVNLIALKHHDTLKSLFLVDHFKPLTSLPNTAFSQTAENALVMLSWRCKILSHLTIIGFEFSESDLIAITRLRGAQLKELNVPSCCISLMNSSTFEDEGYYEDDRFYLDRAPSLVKEQIIEDISKPLNFKWKPLPFDEIPKSVVDINYSPDSAYLDLLLHDQ